MDDTLNSLPFTSNKGKGPHDSGTMRNSGSIDKNGRRYLRNTLDAQDVDMFLPDQDAKYQKQKT